MKIVAISDTHGKHRSLTLPEGDLLVHAGDFSTHGDVEETSNFLAWLELEAQRFTHGAVFISGNHDFLDYNNPDLFAALLRDKPHVRYLKQTSVTIDGINIFGSPYTPKFFDWAFMKERHDDIEHVWNQIPENTDLLITHGPPSGILDLTSRYVYAGCEMLRKHVFMKRVKHHVFGHIHESYGGMRMLDTNFYNVAILDERYKISNEPTEFEI